MARATFQEVEMAAAGVCPSCGSQGHPRWRLVTEKNKVAWDGCAFCRSLAAARGQGETLAALCREADREERPRPNVKALLG